MLFRAIGLPRAHAREDIEPHVIPLAQAGQRVWGNKLLDPRQIGICLLLALALAAPVALFPWGQDARTPRVSDGSVGGDNGENTAPPTGDVRPEQAQTSPEKPQSSYAGLPALIESLPPPPPLTSAPSDKPSEAETATPIAAQEERAPKPNGPVLSGAQGDWPESTNSIAREHPTRVQPRDQAKAEFIGKWGINPTACAPAGLSKGLIPITIDTHVAKAGPASCLFGEKTQNATGWKVVARCSDSKTTWTAHIDLVVKGDRLQWKSERGSETYVRCRSLSAPVVSSSARQRS